MGIHDRHYIRDQATGGGGRGIPAFSSWRLWTVNTWIIVVCVAVFVLDGFLYTVAPIEIGMGTTLSKSIDASAVQRGAVQNAINPRTNKPVPDSFGYYPLFIAQPDGTLVQPIDAEGNPAIDRVQYMSPLKAALHFSTARGINGVQFWRFIGFQFLHANLTHILFNMIGLFFFGPMVERYLGSKRYLAFYLLCGIFGAVMYVLLNLGGYVAHQQFGMDQAIPGLLFYDPHQPLIGASAGVYGVIMAGAFSAPTATVLLFFVIPMKLRTLAYGLVAVALFTVLRHGGNAGGEAGHLGGAIAGFYFIRNAHHLHGFFDFLGRVDPTSHHYRKGARDKHRLRTLTTKRSDGTPPTRRDVDRILDKVHSKGISSLTEREKQILREASER